MHNTRTLFCIVQSGEFIWVGVGWGGGLFGFPIIHNSWITEGDPALVKYITAHGIQLVSQRGTGTHKVGKRGTGTHKVGKRGTGTHKASRRGTGSHKVSKRGTGSHKVSQFWDKLTESQLALIGCTENKQPWNADNENRY